LDGVVGFGASGVELQTEYKQLFRSGITESVLGLQIHDQNKISMDYERDVINELRQSLWFLGQSNVPPPIYIFLSLLGVKDTVPFFISRMHRERLPVKHNDLILPEVVVDDLSSNPAIILRPLFDKVWNAYGYEQSRNYDKNGAWHGRGSEP
jgi:hypothetical protein